MTKPDEDDWAAAGIPASFHPAAKRRALAYQVDRALALPHREDDNPCSCDECMAYGAEDAGADWYRIPSENRVAMRLLDGADDRLAALTQAFRDHEAAQPALDERYRALVHDLAEFHERGFASSSEAIEVIDALSNRAAALEDSPKGSDARARELPGLGGERD